MKSLQTVGLSAGNLQELLEVILFLFFPNMCPFFEAKKDGLDTD